MNTYELPINSYEFLKNSYDFPMNSYEVLMNSYEFLEFLWFAHDFQLIFLRIPMNFLSIPMKVLAEPWSWQLAPQSKIATGSGSRGVRKSPGSERRGCLDLKRKSKIVWEKYAWPSGPCPWGVLGNVSPGAQIECPSIRTLLVFPKVVDYPSVPIALHFLVSFDHVVGVRFVYCHTSSRKDASDIRFVVVQLPWSLLHEF